MDLGFKLAVSNRNLKHPTSRQIFGDTSGLLCKNDQILRHKEVLDCNYLLFIDEKEHSFHLHYCRSGSGDAYLKIYHFEKILILRTFGGCQFRYFDFFPYL